MCAILGILKINSNPVLLRKQAVRQSRRQQHRGPDWSGTYACADAILVHERLSIVDVEHGAQPLKSPDFRYVLAVNGEIYNHRELEKGLSESYGFQTNSDCEVILPLYQESGEALLDQLNGIFAFILYDTQEKKFLVARDHIGIIPLYTGHDHLGNIYFASEMKALTEFCSHVEIFPPGCYMTQDNDQPVSYYDENWADYNTVRNTNNSIDIIREKLEKAVHRQLMSDVPYGVLLSGGLDSTIITAVAQKYSAKRIENDDNTDAWWPRLHSFAIGLNGSPDLEAARSAAQYIGTIHHEFLFTIEEGLDALHDVIYHIESYDVTTVRASTPMYLLARRIRSMGVKMVLSGEGADEIFGGYLYFHKAPDSKAFHEETVRKLKNLHYYDCLRANKSMAAWGIEARVPFLDREFLDEAMNINPSEKMISGARQEKQILRDAFQDILPPEVIKRQKEQFSDGVGYSWINSLKDAAAKMVTDQQIETSGFRFKTNTPSSKEEYLYRSIFEECFPLESAADTVSSVPSVACSTTEALKWDEGFQKIIDPSGRSVINVHSDSY